MWASTLGRTAPAAPASATAPVASTTSWLSRPMMPRPPRSGPSRARAMPVPRHRAPAPAAVVAGPLQLLGHPRLVEEFLQLEQRVGARIAAPAAAHHEAHRPVEQWELFLHERARQLLWQVE